MLKCMDSAVPVFPYSGMIAWLWLSGKEGIPVGKLTMVEIGLLEFSDIVLSVSSLVTNQE